MTDLLMLRLSESRSQTVSFGFDSMEMVPSLSSDGFTRSETSFCCFYLRFDVCLIFIQNNDPCLFLYE